MLCLPVGSNISTPHPMYDPRLLSESVQNLAPPFVRASESMIVKSNLHVQQFTEMRDFSPTVQKKAQEDKNNSVPWESRTDAEYADYAQNVDIPHFGSKQPGETYYYLPWEFIYSGL